MLPTAAQIVSEGIEETLSYMSFPSEHRCGLWTDNPLERLNRAPRRRTRVVGAFPDGQIALVLMAAGLRHVAGAKWGREEVHEYGQTARTDAGKSQHPTGPSAVALALHAAEAPRLRAASADFPALP